MLFSSFQEPSAIAMTFHKNMIFKKTNQTKKNEQKNPKPKKQPANQPKNPKPHQQKTICFLHVEHVSLKQLFLSRA